MRAPGDRRRAAGFSLIELVTVLVLIAALAVFVAPRLNVSGFERYAFRQELLSGLRFAQKTAVASRCDVGVSLDAAAEEFALFYRSGGTDTTCGSGGFSDPVPDPAQSGDFARTGASGVDLQTSGTVVFDGSGGHRAGPTRIDFGDMPAITIDGVTGFIDE